MSVTSWLKEFYPEAAEDSSERLGDEPRLLTELSLQKWKGRLPESLAKHEIEQTPLIFAAVNCTLCYQYSGCTECPLALSRGGVQCDEKTEEEEDDGVESPWERRVESPQPMIDALEATLVWLDTPEDER